MECVKQPTKLEFIERKISALNGLSNGLTNGLSKSPRLSNNHLAIPDIVDVACGGRHSMLLLANGQVLGFGNNSYAQLGYDFRENKYKENQVNHLFIILELMILFKPKDIAWKITDYMLVYL